MSDPIVSRAQAWLAAHEDELLENYRTLLRFPSIESDPLPGAPFGQANREALDFMLGLGASWGMTSVDIEGYCGFSEFGEGEKLVMSLGHLDVVPVGPGWRYPPFGAEMADGYVYSRGAVDDKGPTIASFYAMRALMEVAPGSGTRFRSVFGCDEESGFKCIERYVETEEIPTYGIAPDSGWPLIHAEKGIANLVIERQPVTGALEVLEICGGERSNIVVDRCTARVRVASSARAFVDEKLAGSWDRNVAWTWNGDVLEVEGRGKAAHGAWPIGGDNAATRVFRFLREISPTESQSSFEHLMEVGHIGGDGIGLAGSDEASGALSANVGIVRSEGGRIQLTVNVRYPVTWKGADIQARAAVALAKMGPEYRLASFDDSPPLYFPLDHPLVAAICEAYREETGDTKKAPGVMGGGTYARAIPNTVSIGTGWEGDGDAHETDERCAVASLFKMSRIYAHILWKMSTI